ncbi:hypothetical protein E4U50_005792 [Claviceps purpurea]|nr:hypothetical protein E4U50_005792 [Claviceps purpurea]
MWTVAEAGESTGSIAKEAQQRWLVGLARHELRRPSHRGGISSAFFTAKTKTPDGAVFELILCLRSCVSQGANIAGQDPGKILGRVRLK